MNLPLFVFSKEVVDNGSNKTTKQKSKGDADNKNGVVDEDIFHFLLSHKLLAHLIAFILGCISGPFWLTLFYRIRGQRKAKPERPSGPRSALATGWALFPFLECSGVHVTESNEHLTKIARGGRPIHFPAFI